MSIQQQEQQNKTVREALAEYAHEAWSGWMRHLFSKCATNALGDESMGRGDVERWLRQMATPYADLSEAEKESDRAEADKMLEIVVELSENLESPTKLVARYQRCVHRLLDMFDSDPLPDADLAHFLVERLESLIDHGLLRPKDGTAIQQEAKDS